MTYRRSRRPSLAFAFLLGASGVVVACSSSNTTTMGAASESHGAVQMNGSCTSSTDVLHGTAGAGAPCQTYADCAPVCCACSKSSASFSAAACVNGLCTTHDTTCPLSKKAEYCPGDPVATDGGTKSNGPDASADASIMCVPFTGSHATDREAERLATMKDLITQVTTSSGGGTLTISRDGANRPTSVTFSASGAGESYNVSITYDSAGNVTNFRRSWSGATQTDTHTLGYDSNEKLTSYRLSWSGSTPTETETLGYDVSKRLTSWRQSWSDSQPTESESLSYDATGYLASWRRSWSDSQPTQTESFVYDADHRLTSWRRSWSDATSTESAMMSYTGASRTPSSTQTSGSIAGGSSVVDCQK